MVLAPEERKTCDVCGKEYYKDIRMDDRAYPSLVDTCPSCKED